MSDPVAAPSPHQDTAAVRVRLIDLHTRLGAMRVDRDRVLRAASALADRAVAFDGQWRTERARADAAERAVADLAETDADRQREIKRMASQIKALKADLAEARAALAAVKTGTRYRIGDAIARALRPPFHRMLWLPVTIVRQLRRRGSGSR